MSLTRISVTLPLLAVSAWMIAPATLGQIEPGLEAVTRSAAIRIELPPGASDDVSVVFEEDALLLELPEGSSFPLDLAEASGGLLRGGRARTVEATNAMHLTFLFGEGFLHRLEMGDEAVVLHLRSYGSFDYTSGADEYRLGPRDKILITVHNQPELSTSVVIGRTGSVTLPLLGEVRAAGYSVNSLAARLAQMLERDYVVDPQVDVQVEEYNSQWVLVSGAVQTPGKVVLRGGADLKEVLAEAGGVTAEAGDVMRISRSLPETGETVLLVVDRDEFERGLRNPRIRHGDIVTVEPAKHFYIQGEVERPGRLQVEKGLTLLRAISLAGGLSEWAKRKEIKIIREGVRNGEEVHDLDDIERGLAADPTIRGGEVVIVKRRFF